MVIENAPPGMLRSCEPARQRDLSPRVVVASASAVTSRRGSSLPRSGCADEYQAARNFFGLSARETRERVRMDRALRRLPQIERAFAEGELCYSRVREVTRVATAATELDWLGLARLLDMRSLERRVAAEREPTGARSEGRDERRADEAIRTEWTGAGTVRVTFELSSEGWSLLGRALREARRAGAAGPGDGEAMEAVARAALSLLTQRVGASDGRRGVIVYAGSNSGRREPDAGDARVGMAQLEPSAAVARGGPTNGGATACALGTRVTQLGSAAFETEATQLGSAAAPGPAETPGAMVLGSGPDRSRGEPDRSRDGPDLGRSEASGDPTEQRMDDERTRIAFGERIGIVSGERVGIVSGEQGLPCEPAERLLQIMGHRKGWNLDALAEASGLSVREVSVALTRLELGGCVQRRAFAFDPG
jgi:hypothetical protein